MWFCSIGGGEEKEKEKKKKEAVEQKEIKIMVADAIKSMELFLYKH